MILNLIYLYLIKQYRNFIIHKYKVYTSEKNFLEDFSKIIIKTNPLSVEIAETPFYEHAYKLNEPIAGGNNDFLGTTEPDT